MISPLENIDYIRLILIEYQGDNVIGIFYVMDIIFAGSPKREIELLTQFSKSLSCRSNRIYIEDAARMLTLQEKLNLWKILHLNGKEEWPVGDGGDVEAEAEAG